MPAYSVKKIDHRSQADARHLRDASHGDAVEVVHNGNLRGDLIAVEALWEDAGRFCSEHPMTVLAFLDGKTVEDALGFGGQRSFYPHK